MQPFPRFATSYLLVCLLLGLATSVSAQELNCRPCWHAFGKVQTGSSTSFNVQLKNSGRTSLQITSDSVQGKEFSIGTFPLPMTLNSGATVEMPIIFTPTTQGHASGNIKLTDTGEDSELEVKLAGTGVGQGSYHSVALSWVPGDQDWVGFNIYRSTIDGGPYTKINSSLDPSASFTDTTVDGGMTYYYCATEVNAQGEESAYSNIAEATIPD
jgi:hypothetical protein